MGFRVAVSFGFVLLLSGGNLCFATQSWLTPGSNETLNQTPNEQVTTSLQQASQLSPSTFRLKTYQLRKPANKQSPSKSGGEQMQTSQNLQGTETTASPEARKTAHAEKVLVQGPKLNPGRKEPQVLVKAEQPAPAPAESVSVRCGEEKVTIAVKKNFLGNGQLIHPDDLSLGGCMAVDAVDHILLFETELHGCGGTVTMTEVALIYTYSLTYSPTPIGNTSILKTNAADVTIRCHFQRRQYVSSSALRPSWKTSALEMQAVQWLHFSLRLMTEDWQSRRPSNVYSVRDVIQVEAAVLQGHHVPLRVFVDSCVVTLNPDPSSQPRYAFINDHGCMTDAKLTGAQSYFMPRSQEDKLHFQLKAFTFKQDDRSSLYVTCRMTATTLDGPIDSQHKACSFLSEAGRWVASGGDNKVCGCCETSCGGQRWKRSSAADAASRWEGTAVLGPILMEDGAADQEPVPRDAAPPASDPSPALLCAAGVAVAAGMVFISALVCSRRPTPTGYSVGT